MKVFLLENVRVNWVDTPKSANFISPLSVISILPKKDKHEYNFIYRILYLYEFYSLNEGIPNPRYY